jgi:hypothetical protein
MTEMKDIPEFPGYKATVDGRIWSDISGRFLVLRPNNKGYLQVGLYVDKKCYRKYVHRLIALTHVENAQEHNVVNHLDNNILNNHVLNLEWTTTAGNVQHAAKQGRMAVCNAKLTESQVNEIWQKYLEPRDKTAKQYGVTPDAVLNIYSGRSWGHLYERYSHLKTGRIFARNQQGSLNALSKLTETQVIELFTKYEHLNHRDAAEAFGVTAANIRCIRAGKSWCQTTWIYVTPKKWSKSKPTPTGVDTSDWGFS